MTSRSTAQPLSTELKWHFKNHAADLGRVLVNHLFIQDKCCHVWCRAIIWWSLILSTHWKLAVIVCKFFSATSRGTRLCPVHYQHPLQIPNPFVKSKPTTKPQPAAKPKLAAKSKPAAKFYSGATSLYHPPLLLHEISTVQQYRAWNPPFRALRPLEHRT